MQQGGLQVVFLCLIVTLGSTLATCPDGWTLSLNKCYYMTWKRSNWYSAVSTCASLGATLIEITTDAEYELILSMVDDAAWIYCNDIGTESSYVCGVDNHTMTYINWQPDQPDNYGDDEDCLHLQAFGGINDIGCITSLYVICQQEVPPVSLVLTPNRDSMLGGKEITVAGPAFGSTDDVRCRFGDIVTTGLVDNATSATAKCVTPFSTTTGYLPFALSLDGGATYPYESRFQVVMPIYQGAKVSMSEDGDVITVTWDTEFFPSTVGLINVAVYAYNDAETSWYVDVILAANVTYSAGQVEVTKPSLAAVDSSTGLVGAIGVVGLQEGMGSLPPLVMWSDVGSLLWLHPQDSVSWCADWGAAETAAGFTFLEDRTPCPCSLDQAVNDFAAYFPLPICRQDLWGLWDGNCKARPGAHHCVVSRQPSANGAGQECCYDDSQRLLEDRLGDSGFGHAHRFHSDVGVPFFTHFVKDVIPAMQCCQVPFADPDTSSEVAMESCGLYNAARPSMSCAQYLAPAVASVFGTTHFITPDNTSFTFNGQGEYTLLDIDDGEFVMQIRLERLVPKSASIPTVVAITLSSGDVMNINTSSAYDLQVSINKNTSSNYGYLIAEDGTDWFLDGVAVTFGEVGDVRPIHPAHLAFDNGVGLWVQSFSPTVHLVITIPSRYKGKTTGLLGTFNGDPTDDFQLSDGTTMPADTTEEELFYAYNSSWMITQNESLFQYLPGLDTTSFSRRSYVPFFTPDDYGPIPPICGTSEFCPFEYASTTEILANFTRDFELDFDIFKDVITDAERTTCPAIAPYTNGGTPGTYVAFTDECDECRQRLGPDGTTCTDELIWDGSPPTCVESSLGTCPDPIPPENGQVTLNSCRREATFECRGNLTLSGQSVVTCDDTGSWIGEFPTCDCPNSASRTSMMRPHLWWLIIIPIVLLIIIVFVIVCRRKKSEK